MWFSKEDFLYEMFSGKIRKKGFPDRTFERKILFSFVSYIYLGYPPKTRYMLSSPRHTGVVLVFVLQITSVCDFLFWWLCAFLVVF